jgi:hypothetical protein
VAMIPRVSLKKSLATFLSFVLLSQVVFAHLPEKNMWEDRKISRVKTSPAPLLYAQAPLIHPAPGNFSLNRLNLKKEIHCMNGWQKNLIHKNLILKN